MHYDFVIFHIIFLNDASACQQLIKNTVKDSNIVKYSNHILF